MCIHESIFVQIVSNNLHLGAFLPHPGAFLLHFGAFLPHSGALAFFAPWCPILLTPPLAPGGKMAGRANDSIVSEEHCKLLDHVQAVC